MVTGRQQSQRGASNSVSIARGLGKVQPATVRPRLRQPGDLAWSPLYAGAVQNHFRTISQVQVTGKLSINRLCSRHPSTVFVSRRHLLLVSVVLTIWFKIRVALVSDRASAEVLPTSNDRRYGRGLLWVCDRRYRMMSTSVAMFQFPRAARFRQNSERLCRLGRCAGSDRRQETRGDNELKGFHAPR